jgi:hypothetical protein
MDTLAAQFAVVAGHDVHPISADFRLFDVFQGCFHLIHAVYEVIHSEHGDALLIAGSLILWKTHGARGSVNKG